MSQQVADATDKQVPTHSSSPTKRSTYIYAAVAVISLLGLADATYLTIEHVTGQSVRCTIIAGCSEVLSSQYAVVGGMPLAMIGAGAYFTVFALGTLAAFGYKITGALLNLLVAAMVVVSLWLVYLQAFVIRSFCQYCLFSAAITLALATLLLIRWRKP
ncbi:MAG TPA: vitamin K epoxide reductase family protein [Pyrinomonadaceae bacterium]|nr:vitamin K epoxide reductase family protein [Pyrinomonadaceae bacterium]